MQIKMWAALGLSITSSLGLPTRGFHPERSRGRLSTSIPAAGSVLLNLGSAFIVDENTASDTIPKPCSRFPLLSQGPFYQQTNDRGSKQPQHCN
jgi:hypothetical protein